MSWGKTASRRPASEVTLRASGPTPSKPVTTDAEGRFTVRGMAPDEAVAPRVRVGGAVNLPTTYELDKHDGPVTIELRKANAAGFTGRTVDKAGKPVAGAKVTLYHMLPQVGRSASYFLQQTTEGVTDAEGRYRFAAMWPGDRTHTLIEAAGYAKTETPYTVGKAGETHDFGDSTLARNSYTVRGVVRNADGTPAAGAEVFGAGTAKKPTTKAAADGTFTLPDMPEGAAFVLARAPGRKLALATINTHTDAVTLTLAKADGVPVPPPAFPPGHEASIDTLAKCVATLLWESHGTFGWGKPWDFGDGQARPRYGPKVVRRGEGPDGRQD